MRALSLLFFERSGNMNLTQIASKAQHYTKKNASTILSCLGALGVVGTTLSAI